MNDKYEKIGEEIKVANTIKSLFNHHFYRGTGGYFNLRSVECRTSNDRTRVLLKFGAGFNAVVLEKSFFVDTNVENLKRTALLKLQEVVFNSVSSFKNVNDLVFEDLGNLFPDDDDEETTCHCWTSICDYNFEQFVDKYKRFINAREEALDMTTIWITRDLYSSSFENDIDKYISGKLKKETHKIEEMFAEAEVFCNLALKAIDYCNKRKEPAFTVNYTKDDIKRIKEKVENAKKIYISKKNVNGGREI